LRQNVETVSVLDRIAWGAVERWQRGARCVGVNFEKLAMLVVMAEISYG
jgi:hypothetical protein